MNLELAFRDIEAQRARAERDGETASKLLSMIEKLAGIAENHERRLGDLEN